MLPVSSSSSSPLRCDVNGGGEPIKARQSLLTEMYEYILSQHDGPPCDDRELRRYLDIGHFDALSQYLDFSLSDLSMYVLAYHLGCSPKPVLRISERAFAAGVEAAWNHAEHTQHSQLPCCGADGERAWSEHDTIRTDRKFDAHFCALRCAVLATNTRIWTDASTMAEFYAFMHAWGLRGTDGEERVRGALELWELFFRVTPHPPRDKCESCFHSYKYFCNRDAWFMFVRSPDFAFAHSPDLPPISSDVWNQLLPFSDQPPSYDTYSTLDAWPNTMDHFVQWVRRATNHDTHCTLIVS